MDSDTWRGQCLIHRHITTKEVIKDTTHLGTILHAQLCFKLCGINDNIAATLREEQGAIEDGGLIVATVVVLQFRLYLPHLQFLFEETFELGQTGVIGHLRHIHTCKIEFVTQQKGFLLVHLGFAHQCAHEDIGVANTIIITLLSGCIAVGVALLRVCACVGWLIRWQYRDTHTIGGILLAIHLNARRWDSECALLIGYKRVGEGLLESGRPLTIDERGGLRGGGIGTRHIVKIRKLRSAQVFGTLIHRIGELEWTANDHLRRCRGLEHHILRYGGQRHAANK